MQSSGKIGSQKVISTTNVGLDELDPDRPPPDVATK